MSAEDWTPDRVHLLRQWRIVDGLSAGQIAAKLNRMTGSHFSRNAVIGKLIRLGIEPPSDLKGCRPKQTRAQHARALGKSPPPLVFAPVRAKGAAASEASVRFIDRAADQCPMFCASEDGAEGLICGRPVSSGAWCADCARLVYVPPEPVKKKRAA